MCRDKRCGNCKHFKNADEYGYGVCEQGNRMYPSLENKGCDLHRSKDGWTEITPDNMEELYPVIDRVIVAYKLDKGLAGYSSLTELYKPLKDLALTGGYYYYVLPELKIE